MLKPAIYLEIRILLSAVPEVFKVTTDFSDAKDVLSVKEQFIQRNNGKNKIMSVEILPSPLRKAATLIKALGGKINPTVDLEKFISPLQEPPDDRQFNGFSVQLGQGGDLDIMFHHKAKTIQIEEYRMEENLGHLIRKSDKVHTDWTYAGCPCLRIKTAPVFELGDEAEIFLQELYTIMAYLKLTTGELGEAAFRCNAYITMTKFPEKPNYLIKLRNLNSFNFVRNAINYEIGRQEKLFMAGETFDSESRLWIEENHSTQFYQDRSFVQTSFCQVDENLKVDLSYTENVGLDIELPNDRRMRFRKDFGLSNLRSRFLCEEKDRADYFEKAVENGAEPHLCARWIAGELTGLLNAKKISINQTRLSAENFSSIIQMLYNGKIHSEIAKDLIYQICNTGENPVELINSKNWSQLSTKEELENFIQKAMDENPQCIKSLIHGEMQSLERLTGEVMKATNGRANPRMVKSLIKDKLKISVVYVLTMGGAITGTKLPDGTVAAGSADTIKPLLKNISDFPVQITPVRAVLSEEMEPGDLAKLVAEIKSRMESGVANGIVITHGTDTLSYTAALLFWLFSSAKIPVVLSASSDLPEESDQAKNNLSFAIKTAGEKKSGVYLAYKCKLYSPLNLKFTSSKNNEFTNWNLDKNIFEAQTNISNSFMSVESPDPDVLAQLMNEAADKLEVVKIHPGLKTNRLRKLINDDYEIKNIIVELYSNGTGNMRNSDYSLKDVFINGKKKGIHFYCTSQQECKVDFSKYSTSAKVWRGGAVPMDFLTTESVVALYFAACLLADNDDELNQLMEDSLDFIS